MILYEGPSLLDGTPIVAIATEDINPKTGRMLFTWILRQDRPPEVAAYDGSDDAICGDCKFRATAPIPQGQAGDQRKAQQSRTCYVRLSPEEGADEAMPPSEVWRKWKAGNWRPDGLGYDTENWTWQPGSPVFQMEKTSHFPGWRTAKVTSEGLLTYRGPLPVRIGSYGDPAAVPTRVWAELVRYTKNWTGYSHMVLPAKSCEACGGRGSRWSFYYDEDRTCEDCEGRGKVSRCDPELKRYCMASVDTPEERDEAQALGWRTFMVVPDNQRGPGWTGDMYKKLPWEGDILCPATDPHPKRNASCATCLLCRGTSAHAPSIWEQAHGKQKGNHTWT